MFQIWGSFRMSASTIYFKNPSTGKVISIHEEDVLNTYWQRLANKPGLKVITNKGLFYRFGGFKDTVLFFIIFIFVSKYQYILILLCLIKNIQDFNKFFEFINKKWSKELIKKELCYKGWNYGDTKFEGFFKFI